MAQRFEVDQVVQIFKNDTELTAKLQAIGFTLVGDSTYPLLDTEYINTATLLLNNKDHISSRTAKTLVAESFLKSQIQTAMRFGDSAIDPNRPLNMDPSTHQQIFYTFKYSAVKIFFRKNYRLFLPEYDHYQIISAEKTKVFAEAFVREFDRFSLMIDNLSNTIDIDNVSEDYLDYLGQLIGYEREDYVLLTEASFRELLKNIIEIYRIKGTNYSMELFFNFLGFDIDLQEFWFDKRYGDDGLFINEYTGGINKSQYAFYLTPIKPTEIILSGMEHPYLISDDEIIPTQDLNQFNKWTEMYEDDSTTGYSYKALIGDTTGYPGTKYSFFKTNILQYTLTTLGTEVEPELTEEDLRVIGFYVKFLTPIFIQKGVLVSLRPYSEYGYGLYPGLDYDRTNPQGDSLTGLKWIKYEGFTIISIDPGDWAEASRDGATVVVNDTTQALYNYLKINHVGYIRLNTGDTNEGTYRVKYTIESGEVVNDVTFSVNKTTINLENPLPGDSTVGAGDSVSISYSQSMFHLYEGLYPSDYYYEDGDTSYTGDTIPGSPLKYGGHWISGFHTDTYQKLYDMGDSESVYNVIAAANPSYTHDQILEYISDELSDGDTGLWHYPTWGVRRRDLIAPMRGIFGDSFFVYKEDLLTGSSFTFSNDWIFDSGDYYRRSENFDHGDTGRRVKILSIDVDLGGGDTAKVVTYDPIHKYRGLSSSDSVELYYLGDTDYGDTNEGIYSVDSATAGDSGDSGDTTIITLAESLPGINQGDSGGFLILHNNDWLFGDSRFPFYFDKMLYVYNSSNEAIGFGEITVFGAAATEYTV